MSLVSRALVVVMVWAGLKACATSVSPATTVSAAVVAQPFRAALRVCADPNNMPFSDDKQRGFENKIAQVIAKDLGRPLEYFWAPQRRGFIRNTLRAGHCDLVMGIPANYELASATHPYYRSTYVFVSRADRRLNVRSFDDPQLKTLRIGIQITGTDYSNPPAAQALAARHITSNIRGYTVYGDYSKPDPQRDVVDGVARGDVDMAIVWGPLAGYYAKQEKARLTIVPVSPDSDGPTLPFTFAIAMGVRKNDRALHDAVDRAIARRKPEIDRILREFGVPVVASSTGARPSSTVARAFQASAGR